MEGYSDNSDHESYEPALVRGLAHTGPLTATRATLLPPDLSSDEEAGDPELYHYLDDIADLRTTLPD